MRGWIARYEEGYVSTEGDTVSLLVELRPDQAWHKPEEAIRHWLSLESLSGARVEMEGNGFIQTDDVRHRERFRELGVAQIWRKVTFVLSQDSVRTNARIGVIPSDAK